MKNNENLDLEKPTLFYLKNMSIRIERDEPNVYLTIRAEKYNVRIGANKDEFWVDNYEIKKDNLEHFVSDD